MWLAPLHPGQRCPVHIEEEERREGRGGVEKEKNKAVITAAHDIHILFQGPE